MLFVVSHLFTPPTHIERTSHVKRSTHPHRNDRLRYPMTGTALARFTRACRALTSVVKMVWAGHSDDTQSMGWLAWDLCYVEDCDGVGWPLILTSRFLK